MKIVSPGFYKNLSAGASFMAASLSMDILLILVVILFIPTLGWSWTLFDRWMQGEPILGRKGSGLTSRSSRPDGG